MIDHHGGVSYTAITGRLLGIRIMMTKEAGRAPNDLGLDRILRAAVRHDFPVNMLCWGNLDAGTALIDRHPGTSSRSICRTICPRNRGGCVL